jgi:hypothetical protein
MLNKTQLNRTSVYIPLEVKVKLMRKAQRLNLPLSQLLIKGAEQYEVNSHVKQ